MNLPGNPRNRLSILLWLVALHSLAVGIALIVLPQRLFDLFGYAPIGDPFFKVQGGVFHLVMVIAYALAASRPDTNQPMVVFSFLAKFTAVIFLCVYFLLVDRLIIVFLSGIGDAVMGILIYTLNRAFKAWRLARP